MMEGGSGGGMSPLRRMARRGCLVMSSAPAWIWIEGHSSITGCKEEFEFQDYIELVIYFYERMNLTTYIKINCRALVIKFLKWLDQFELFFNRFKKKIKF